MFYFNRCLRCNSIWVCWNWFHDGEIWMHECWNCANSWITYNKQTGVPYRWLRAIGKYFVDDKLYDENLAKDMAQIQSLFGVDEEEW